MLFSNIFVFNLLITALIFIIAFLLFCLGLFCSYFLKRKLIIDLRLFLSTNINVECYKFPFQHYSHYICQMLICCIFTFIQVTFFFCLFVFVLFFSFRLSLTLGLFRSMLFSFQQLEMFLLTIVTDFQFDYIVVREHIPLFQLF